MKPRLLSLIAILLTFNAFAQLKQEVRKEMEYNEGTGHTMVIGEMGVLIHGETESKGDNDQWKVTHLDTDLKEKSAVTFNIPKRFYLARSVASPDNKLIYFLFVNRKQMFQVTIYDTKTTETRSVSGVLPPKFSTTGMELLGETLFVSGYIKRNETLITINTNTGKGTMVQLPGLGKRMFIDEMVPLEENNAMVVSVIYMPTKKERVYEICFIGEDGKKVSDNIKPNTGADKNILSSSITWLGKDHYILSGAYSSDKRMIANGMYIAEFKGEQMEFIKYTNFSELKKFYDYLENSNYKNRVIKRAEKRKKKNKEDAIKVYMVTHPVFERNGEYVLIGEVYFPTYRTVTTTTTVNGRPSTTTQQVFDGYQYSHAVAIGTDKSGNRLWDQSIEMGLTIKPYFVIRNLTILHNKDVIKGFFSTGSNLKSFTIESDEAKSVDLGKIETEHEGDKVKWTGFTTSEYWYDSYFICYGSQRIKNTEDKGVDRKRTVFFVSKVRFD